MGWAIPARWRISPVFVQGLNDPPGVAQADIPGLQLALAVIISLYVLRDKKSLGLGERPVLPNACRVGHTDWTAEEVQSMHKRLCYWHAMAS